MKNKEADYTIIANGIQIIPDRYNFVLDEFEWENKERLFDIISRANKSGVILLSGDVHFSQFYKTPCTSLTNGYPLYELTSSGMTHSAWTQFHCPTPFLDFVTPNLWTASEIVNELNFGVLDFTH